MALCSVTACSGGQGWADPDYEDSAPPPREATGKVTGITVLVGFSDEAVGDAEAVKLYRMMNEPGYADDGNVGSVRDYFLDASNGQLDLQSQVVRVRVDGAKADYDTAEVDKFDARGAQSIEDVTVNGPSTRLLEEVLCKLVTCAGTPPDYQVVTASGVSSAHHDDFDFTTLSKRRLSFWPDHYVRTMTQNSYAVQSGYRQYIDIPDIELYHYVNLMYAGKTVRGYGQGLWPRSVPSIGTLVPGADPAVKLGRFQLQGTVAPDTSSPRPGETFLGYVVHESAHTLFDLPDLYDAGDELELELGSSLVKSHGIGTHGLMGFTASQKNLPLLSAPLKDRLGWATVKDISDAAEGTTITLAANGREVARYCRPGSISDECFYLEVRSRSEPRGPSGLPLEAPDEGLVIWHAENTKNVLDIVVNNNEEMTPGLHYEISLVQADGDFELENPGRGVAEDDDYFRAGHADRFDGFTTPRSHWWDGTPSGLAIRNISAVGSRMSFEIGRRPSAYLHVDADEHARVDAGDPVILVGEPRTVRVTPEPGYVFDIEIAGHRPLERVGASGARSFQIQGSLKDTLIHVRSYPAAQSGPVFSAERRVRFAMTEGVEVAAFVATGRSLRAGSRIFDGEQAHMGFFPGQNASASGLWPEHPYDMLFRSYEGRRAARIVAKSKPGFMLKSLDVYGTNHPYVSRTNALSASQLSTELAVPSELAGASEPVLGYRALINAEAIPGYFCRQGFVEPWDVRKVYANVGDKVRYGNFIYSSNVPRNFMRSNLGADNQLLASPGANPENSPQYWTRFASCEAYVTDCSAARQWSLGGSAVAENPATAGWSNAGYAAGDVTHFNGQLYEHTGGNADEVPGAFASRQTLLAANIYSEVEKNLPIYDNRVFVYPSAAAWRLLGNCSDGQSWRRATIATSAGVASVTPAAVDSVQHRPGEPHFVSNLSRDWSFSFQLEPGYELDDVYVDGRPSGLPASARSLAVDFPDSVSERRPPYIEIRTACSNAVCSGE